MAGYHEKEVIRRRQEPKGKTVAQNNTSNHEPFSQPNPNNRASSASSREIAVTTVLRGSKSYQAEASFHRILASSGEKQQEEQAKQFCKSALVNLASKAKT